MSHPQHINHTTFLNLINQHMASGGGYETRTRIKPCQGLPLIRRWLSPIELIPYNYQRTALRCLFSIQYSDNKNSHFVGTTPSKRLSTSLIKVSHVCKNTIKSLRKLLVLTVHSYLLSHVYVYPRYYFLCNQGMLSPR